MFESDAFPRVRPFRNMGFHGGIPCSTTIDLNKGASLTDLIFLVFQSSDFMQAAVDRVTEINKSARIMLFSNITVLNFHSLDLLNEKSEAVVGWNCFEEPLPEDIAYVLQYAKDPPHFMAQLPFPWKNRMNPQNQPSEKMDLTLLLTDRELEVLVLLAEGASNHRISEVLCITENTAKTHVRRILEKLQINNRTKAALFAIESGLSNQKPNKIVLQQDK